MWARLRTFDLWLLLIPLFLGIIGVVVLYSITLNTYGTTLAIHQLESFAFGLLLYFVFAFANFRSLRPAAPILYLLALLLLLLVTVLGEAEFGARRWIELGLFRFQPSEPMKLALIIALAALLSGRVGVVRPRRLFLAALLVAVPAVLILRQPDLGSAIALLLIGLGVILHAGLTRRQIWLMISLLLLVALVGTLAWYRVGPFSSLLADYQRQRLITFLHPEADPSGAGYNIMQATIAIGSGGVFGQGLGYGSQSQLNFLPVAHTDFIFASLAEAWGFVGSWLILLIYGILIWRLLTTARAARDIFSRLFIVGIAVWLLAQLTINVGMNLRLLPVTGITLPLLSFGGSSLLTVLVALGMVQSVAIREQRALQE